MFRWLTFGVTFLILVLALPGSAFADHSGNGTCPNYTHRAGAAGNELAFNDRGQALVTLHDGYGTYYVTWDYTVGVTGWDGLFSIWFYYETNGHDGLQRNDEICNNTAPGEEADGGCFC